MLHLFEFFIFRISTPKIDTDVSLPVRNGNCSCEASAASSDNKGDGAAGLAGAAVDHHTIKITCPRRRSLITYLC